MEKDMGAETPPVFLEHGIAGRRTHWRLRVDVARLAACAGLVFLFTIICALSSRGQGALANGGNHDGTITTNNPLDSWTFTASTGDTVLLRVGQLTTTNF